MLTSVITCSIFLSWFNATSQTSCHQPWLGYTKGCMKIVIIRWSIRVNKTSSMHRKCIHSAWTEWLKSPGQLRISGSFSEWKNEGKLTSIIWTAICLWERQCLFDCSPKIQVQCHGINSLWYRGPQLSEVKWVGGYFVCVRPKGK